MLDDLTVYIPTRGRINDQRTWAYLPDSVRSRTFLVAEETEADILEAMGYPVLAHNEDNIGSIRQWILDQHDVEERGPYILYLDDDLRFFYRQRYNKSKFTQLEMKSDGVEKMIVEYRRLLDHCSLAGISPRHMANTNPEPYTFNARVYKTWGGDVRAFRELNVRADRLSHGEDFDVVLQMLTQGRRLVLLNTFIADDAGTQSSGGCSTYRTNAVATECSRRLNSFFPSYTRTVSKPLWEGMEGDEHLEIQVQWKKAYRDGVALYGEEPEFPLTGEDTWYEEELL